MLCAEPARLDIGGAPGKGADPVAAVLDTEPLLQVGGVGGAPWQAAGAFASVLETQPFCDC